MSHTEKEKIVKLIKLNRNKKVSYLNSWGIYRIATEIEESPWAKGCYFYKCKSISESESRYDGSISLTIGNILSDYGKEELEKGNIEVVWETQSTEGEDK